MNQRAAGLIGGALLAAGSCGTALADDRLAGLGASWTPLNAFRADSAVQAFGDEIAPRTALDRLVLGFDAGTSTARDPGLPGGQGGAAGGIRARIGYAFDRFVAYGTAGLAFAPAAGGSRQGFAAGGGVEAALFGGVTARAEYLYVDIDRQALDGPADVSLFAPGGQFRAGLNYRF